MARGPLQKTVDEDLTGWGSVPSVDGTTTSTPATQAAQAETAIEQSIASVSVTPPPPIGVPLVDAQGYATQTFGTWLTKLRTASSGTSDEGKILEAYDSVVGEPARIPDQFEDQGDLQSQLSSLRKQVQELRMLMETAVAGKAPDSARLAGLLPSAYLAAGGTAADSAKLGGVLAASYATQIWVSTSYAPLANPHFTGKPTIAAPAAAGTAEINIYDAAGTDVLALGTTGASYSGLAWLPADTSFMYSAKNFYGGGASVNAISFTWSGPIQAQLFRVGGTQVIGAQQTGMGATLGAATLSGTYATDLSTLQALYNKVLSLETKLKVHGLVAT